MQTSPKDAEPAKHAPPAPLVAPADGNMEFRRRHKEPPPVTPMSVGNAVVLSSASGSLKSGVLEALMNLPVGGLE
jgi:hypothetical protein